MANIYFDRYQSFRNNGQIPSIPIIPLEPKSSDKSIVFKKGLKSSRFDNLSLKYYGNPYHGFLIMLANLQYGDKEFDIPDGSIIRIPFPFDKTLEQYQSNISDYIDLNGI